MKVLKLGPLGRLYDDTSGEEMVIIDGTGAERKFPTLDATGTLRAGTSDSPVSGGGSSLVSTTVYLTQAALAAANPPAAANSGKFALVGTVAPYTLFVSNGTVWSALRSEPGHSTQPSYIYEYNEDGTVRPRCMPRASRVLQQGVRLWYPTALSGTAARTVLAYTGAAFVLQETGTNPVNDQPVEIVSLDGTYCEAAWTGLSIPAQATGLMQVPLWLDDYQNGAASMLGGSVQVRLTSAAGSLTYTFSSTCFKPGLNTIQLWDPADADVNAVMQKSGASTTGTKNIDFSQTITGVAVVFPSPAAGAKARLYGLWSQTIMKPLICMTFDTSNDDVINNFVPAWAAKGLTASLRAGGPTNASNREQRLAQFQSAYAAGFDIYNGSFVRVNLDNNTTEAAFAAEVGKQKNWQARYGLHRGSGMFSSAGNGLPKASIYRKILPLFGLRSAKNGGGAGRITPLGPAGFDDRYALIATGWGGRSAALAQIRGLLKLGGILIWFGHQCEIAGAEPPPDSASPGSGGGMYYEDAVYFANYLRTLQDAGQLDVVSNSQLEDILDGYR